ncbi:MAG: M14 family zinc carboxypeptidase [bacterium]
MTLDLTKYGPYRSAHEIYEHFRRMLDGAPGVEELKLGETWKGRPIYAWGVGGGPGAPSVLYSSGCHAIEFIGLEQNAAIVEKLVKERAGLLEKTRVWFLPVMNPDGHYKVIGQIRRRRCPLVKTNARRVDLNRNYPVGFHEPHKGGIMAGSHRKIINYHGPSPISEPESKALEKLVDIAKPSIALALHSFGGSVRFPPCHTDVKAPDHDLMMRMVVEMAKRQPAPYEVGPEFELYRTYGDINDWLYYDKKTLSFLMEIGKFGIKAQPPQSWWNIFMWTNPPDVRETVANNTDACLYLTGQAADGVKASIA